jgi:hypothetical protein
MYYRLFLTALITWPAIALAESAVDFPDLIQREANAGQACFSAEWGTPPHGTACAEFSLLQETLLEAGKCPKILESSGETYEVIWTDCPVGIAPWSEIREDIDAYAKLNSTCRGSSDPDVYEPACRARDEMDFESTFNMRGWCYGREDEAAYLNTWHGCETGSIGVAAFTPVVVPEGSYHGRIDASSISSVSNSLERSLSADLISRTGAWGNVEVICRRSKTPTVTLSIDYAPGAPVAEASSASIRRYSMTLALDAEPRPVLPASVTIWPREGLNSPLILIELSENSAVTSILTALYDEGIALLSLPEGEDIHDLNIISFSIPDDQDVRDLIANTLTVCESLSKL